MPTIYLGADHAGLERKEELREFLISQFNCIVHDLGASQFDSEDDFPDYAKRVCEEVAKDNNSIGVLICGTGQGMDMAANKIKGVRAAVCWDIDTTKHAREHLDANVLCFGASYFSKPGAKEIVKIFIQTQFLNKEKYIRRIRKVAELEK